VSASGKYVSRKEVKMRWLTTLILALSMAWGLALSGCANNESSDDAGSGTKQTDGSGAKQAEGSGTTQDQGSDSKTTGQPPSGSNSR